MPYVNNNTRPTSPADKLDYAIHLAKSGRKIEARDILRRVVALQPVNQAAWLWLSALATDKTEAEAALAQARQINPNHPSLPRAEQWLANRFSQQPLTQASEVVATPPVSGIQKNDHVFGPFNNIALGLVIAAILMGVIVLVLGVGLQISAVAKMKEAAQDDPTVLDQFQSYEPMLESAQADQNWSQIIAILEPLHQAEPGFNPVGKQLSYAYLQKGVTLRQRGFIEEALPLFEKAVAISADRPQAQRELQLASDYLAGTQHYQAGLWLDAVTALKAVWMVDPNYAHVKDLLYSAYFNHGLASQAANQLVEAKDAFKAAILLRPDLSEPRLHIAEIEFGLIPGTTPSIPLKTPSAQDQLILVGIAEQRMAVFEKGEQVFDFVVSTGEPGRDTAIGEFEILDKIDVAYASTWNLDMPYWMGIYWSGPLENGIHSLPIVKHTGYKLWDGYLGQRVSYGCVILSDEDAATLYNWAQIGAKVKIVPSLANWTPEQQLD